MKVKASGECFIYVEGMSMNCFLCGVIVRSGERHHCKRLEAEAKHQTRLRREIAAERRKVKR